MYLVTSLVACPVVSPVLVRPRMQSSFRVSPSDCTQTSGGPWERRPFAPEGPAPRLKMVGRGTNAAFLALLSALQRESTTKALGFPKSNLLFLKQLELSHTPWISLLNCAIIMGFPFCE